jgi:hypothetical protein
VPARLDRQEDNAVSACLVIVFIFLMSRTGHERMADLACQAPVADGADEGGQRMRTWPTEATHQEPDDVSTCSVVFERRLCEEVDWFRRPLLCPVPPACLRLWGQMGWQGTPGPLEARTSRLWR